VTDPAEALMRGDLVVLPTDTVYGLMCEADSEEAAARLYALKGRKAIQPTAVVFADVASLFFRLRSLETEHGGVLRALLPGPLTLVLPNPNREYPWLNAERPDAIGVRVPVLRPRVVEIVRSAGGVVATSANLPGGPDPRRLSDVPAAILDGVAATLDGGTLPGVPSTVIDMTASEPEILRHGAADPAAAIATIHATRR
jgi:L-threonylcarbamoyladenylate synthase